MSIRAVWFDADDTLWDLRAVVRRSVTAVLKVLKERVPSSVTESLTVESLTEIRDEVAKEMAQSGLRPTTAFLTDVRRAAFIRTLESIGMPDETLADELNELYFEHRWGPTQPYPDVVPALDQLKERYVLGMLTNGNSKLDSAGLGSHFGFVIYAHDHGVEKPDPKLFLEVLRLTGLEPQEVAYVGDSLRNDVAGAQTVGIHGIWLNRAGAPNDSGVVPDIEISSLLELSDALKVM